MPKRVDPEERRQAIAEAVYRVIGEGVESHSSLPGRTLSSSCWQFPQDLLECSCSCWSPGPP